MPLILAIEPDRRQSTHLTAIVRSRLHADLVLGDSAEEALAALGERVPDLILTSALLSPKDEHQLGDRLRALNGAAAHVQTLTIPVLGAATPRSTITRGLLSALRRERPEPPVIDGCDPAVFADQCAAYLERAAAERAQLEQLAADARAADPALEVRLKADATIRAEAVASEPPDVASEPDVASDFSRTPDATDHEAALEAAIDETVAELTRKLAKFEVVEDGDVDHGDEPLTIEFDLSRLVDAIALPHVEVAPAGAGSAPMSLGVRWQWPAMDGASAETPYVRDSPAAGPALPPPIEYLFRRGPDTMPTDPITPHGTRRASDPLTPARPAAPRPKRASMPRPVQDEWGFFDPDQCGFAALLEKIDEMTKTA